MPRKPLSVLMEEARACKRKREGSAMVGTEVAVKPIAVTSSIASVGEAIAPTRSQSSVLSISVLPYRAQLAALGARAKTNAAPTEVEPAKKTSRQPDIKNLTRGDKKLGLQVASDPSLTSTTPSIGRPFNVQTRLTDYPLLPSKSQSWVPC